MALQDDVQAILDGGVARGDVAGAVAQIVSPGEVLCAAAAGVRAVDDETAAPMSTDTVCWIASMTKAVTGAAAMQLVESGRLHLDTPAADVLEHLGTVGVLEGFDEEGNPQLRPARTPITLRQLLTHTAGFAYRDLERGPSPLPRGDRCPHDQDMPAGRAGRSGAARPRRAVAVRHEHRPRRSDGRGGVGDATRRLPPATPPGPPGHGLHGVRYQRRHAGQAGHGPHPRRRRRARRHALRDRSGARGATRRRRALQHRGGLQPLPADDPGAR